MLPNKEKYEKAIKEYYETDITITNLAIKYEFDRASFSRYMKKNGFEKKKSSTNRPTEIYKQAKDYYLNNDISIKSLCEQFNISRKSFALYLKENNVDIKIKSSNVKRTINKNFFNVIDTESKAYWLGFIFADGSITNNVATGSYKLAVELSSVDEQHLIKLKNDIESDAKVCKRKGREMSSIHLSNKQIVQDLMKYGCIPNKTDNGFISEDILSLNNKLKNAFIRGYLDGDGFIDKKRYRIVFTIKSFNIVKSLKEMLKSYKIKIIDDIGYYRIVIENKEDYYKFLNDIYGNATIFLDRKYDIYINRCALLDSTATEDLGKQGGKSVKALTC